jgi:signal transduction histidine kinase
MCLVSLVLLAALGAQFVIQYRNAWEGMRNTMRLVVGPWEKPGERFQPIPPNIPDDQDKGERIIPANGEPDKLPRNELEQIITVFFDTNTEEISILDRDHTEMDAALILDAVQEARNKDTDFGILQKEGLIYYRESMQDIEKYAFADVAYLRNRLLLSFMLLLLVFLLTIGLLCLISIWLARRAAEPMEKAIEMERQFVADISHDLKTPITVILANNSILRSEPDAKVGDNLQWIDSTDSAAKNMMHLISQMLTLSSLESTAKANRSESVDLSHIAEKCALQMESIAYDRNISLKTEIDEGIFYRGDREYAERICSGLMENALKYEPDGGSVCIAVCRQKKKALLRVENAGSVIEPEDLPHVFERFYRGDKTRNQQKGHGLGLPIIKQMSELQGGEISVISSADQGTVFTVAFPANE